MPTDGPEPGPTEWSAGAPGVGPWNEANPAVPAEDPRFDPDLLEHGDSRNVVDAYRYWRREESSCASRAAAASQHIAWRSFRNLRAVEPHV